MNRRSMLMIAAVVTALVLVLIAVVAPGLTGTAGSPAPTTAAVPDQPASAPTTAAQPAGAPTTAAAPAQTTTNAQTTGSYPVSADQAGTLAISGAPGATLSGTPTLVSYQGIVAYEVPLSTGMAYVDATTGQVIASFATNGGTTVNSGGTVQGGEGGESGEHEGGEHEGGEGRGDD